MPQAFQDLSIAKVWAGARVAPPPRFVVGTEGADMLDGILSCHVCERA